MSQQTVQIAKPAPQRRFTWLLAFAATLIATALAALWWVDPAEVSVPLCTLHATTGLYCPGCGAVRATHALLHGRPAAALHDNALWIAAMPLLAYAAVSQLRLTLWGRPLPGDPLREKWSFVAAAVALLAFAILRNLPGYPFTLLVPPP